MNGKAGKFFMKHIVNSRHEWTVANLYEGLFNYCFPSHFKLTLCEKFMSTVQGNLNVQDYTQELESMAIRFPDMTERKITQIFWQGLHQYLHLYLIECGLNPEHTELEKLINYVKQKEEAIEAKTCEEHTWSSMQTGCCWGHFTTRNDEPRGPKPEDKNPRVNSQPMDGSRHTNEKRANQGMINGSQPPNKWTEEGNKRPVCSHMTPEECD